MATVSTTTTWPAPRSSSRSESVLGLIRAAETELDEARRAENSADRYAAAHLAALRAAAAVLAVRARPDVGKRSKPRSVWALLPDVAPELGEWAAYFAAGARKRAAAEAGLSRAVSSRDADDLLRDAEMFVALVVCTLELNR